VTAAVIDPGQVSAPAADAVPGRSLSWHRLAVAGICVLAAALYAWRIGGSGWGNPYYSAAVKSMSASLTNFVFGSFDPYGVVTVDKPPMAFWPMMASAALFGYHGWSLLLPQVLEGVAAVLLLHRTVRLWAGKHVAPLAALVFAITPVTVAINRDTNPDTLMVLLLVAAAYAFTRSVRRPVSPGSASRWLMLAAMFLGLGFITKMLQAWIVVPVFALAYMIGSAAPLRRRILDLLGAGAVLLASSLWWVALVNWWPSPKPYFGGSTDGSVLNLVIGYNGLGRILGRQASRELVGGGVPAGPAGLGGAGGPGGGAPWAGGYGRGGFGGGPGITRLFGAQLGGQISWLLPLCLLILAAVAVAAIRRWRSRASSQVVSDPARRAGWVLWGGWLIMVGLVLSAAQSGFHPYYTTEMAPAVAAVSAAGIAGMWRYYRRPGGYHWLVLPAAVALSAGWAWVLVSRDTSWYGWLRYAVATVAILAVVALVAGRLSAKGRYFWASRVAGVLSVVALLLAPGVWSLATAWAPSGGAMAQAGPPERGRGAGPARMRAPATDELTAEQRGILAYAQAHAGDMPITLAVEGGARAAETYLISTDATVVGMGGFSGQDPAPTVTTLAQWVQRHQLRYVLLPSPDAGRRDQPGRGLTGRGLADRGGVSAQRTQWVRGHCAAVNPGASQVLYDCQGAS
ncbi:MAG TPA: glycosyltransferase family 39 protein, partial [Pseudonocardiaceae bacterium]|nr:glycosyltransferase family 39 protein [Pseudonocardiaceae bacterium]